jgi:transposase
MVNCRISSDLKECALQLWEVGWEEINIIQGLSVSRASLYRWRDIFDEIGSVTRPPSPLRGRTRIISRAVLTAVYDIYKGEPDTYLDELQWWLAVNHDIAISLSALQKNLQDAGLTRKLLQKIAKERDEQLRQEYWDVVNGELLGDSDLLVFADETSKNELTLARRFGQALAGERAAFADDVFVRGQRFSLVAAMSKQGYIATKVMPGSFDSFDFFDFISENVVSLVIQFNSIFTNNF